MAKINAKAKWVKKVQSIAYNTRGHGVVLDLGTASGRGNTEPSTLESAIMSLAESAMTIFANVCKNSIVKLAKWRLLIKAEKPS